MESGGTISQGVNDYRTGTQLQEKKISAERLSRIGQTFAADTVAYQLAGRVNENTGAYTLGRMFNEIGATLTEQNISEITEALVQEGMPQTMARKNAKALAAVVEGGVLTENQRLVLEGNEVLARAAKSTIFDQNSTVYQRTKGYNDVLMELAQEMSAPDVSRTNPAQQGGENAAASDTVDAQSENGAEVRADSKVKEIVSLKNGTMKVRLEDGSEVGSKEATYASRGEALIYETVAEMTDDAEAANLLVSVFHSLNEKSALDAEIYAAGIEEAFRYGKANIPVKELASSDFASKLSDIHRNYAYRMGQHHAGLQIAKEQAAVKKTAKQSTTDSSGKVHFDRKDRTFDALREASLKTMEQLSVTLGVEFYVYESYVNGDGKRVYKDTDGNEVSAPNGFYDPETGTIHIDLNAGQEGKGTMLFTAAHELTHFIKQWSPAKFKVLANFLVKQYGEQGVSVSELVQQQMDKGKQNGRSLSWDDAYEEMVADSMETMLNDGNVVQVMADLKAQDKSLWQKIRDWFRDLADDLRKMVDAYMGVKPDTAEGRMVADMQDVIGILESLYEDALADAADSFQRAEKNTAESGGPEVYYSVRVSFANELQAWFDSTTHEERKVSGKRFLVGTTTDVLKSIGVRDYQIYFGGSKIDKILTNNASMTLDTIKRSVQLLEDPILIMQSRTVDDSIVLFGEVYTEGDKPVMISLLLNPRTKSGEVLDYAVITSTYGRRNNNVQNLINNSTIYYVNENKNRTEKWLQALGLQLPSAITKFGSISSIRNNGQKVNEKFSDRDSAGRHLNEDQQEYFKNSKIRDEQGRLLVMYHGTLHGGFTVFNGGKDYWYFTKDRK